MTEPFFAPGFDVRVSGVTMAADIAGLVTALTVETDLDVAGSFSLTLRNPDNALLDSALFDLGKTVEIHLGYGGTLVPAFLGEITSLEPTFPQSGPPVLRIGGYDRSYRLRRNQPEPTDYQFTYDGMIAAQIAVQHGLIPIVDPTPGFHRKITQVESDMAFLKSRAEQYFFDVYVRWDKLYFQFPRPRTSQHVLTWGVNLSSFAPRLSTTGLAGLQVIRGYNQELAQTIFGIALAADLDLDDIIERIGSSAVELLSSLVRRGIRKNTVDNPLDAMLLAKSLLAAIIDGMYEGSGECIGLPELSAGDYLTIEGVGQRFSGTYRVRRVTHRLGDDGFHTTFSITQSAHTSMGAMLRKYLIDDPAPNRAERFFGVVTGVVEANDEVADAQAPIGRVKVSFPGLSDTFESNWAPCASPMAGDGMGFFALPEPGTQVLVAFEHGDLAKPYVVGSLYSVKNAPPATNLDGTNSKRIIKSRAGHTITFDDTLDTGKVVITDQAGSSITLDSTDRSVTIEAKNELTINANGNVAIAAAGPQATVSIESPGDVTVNATGAAATVAVQSTGDLTLKAGKALTVEGTTALRLKSGASGIEITPTAVKIS